MNILALDIGGTFIKWATLNDKYEILKKGKFETNTNNNNGLQIIKNIANFALEINKEFKLSRIGISFPGAIDFKNSTIIGYTPNIPGSQGLNIRKEFHKYFDIPVYIDNDLNVASMGEIHHGALNNVNNGIMIGIGTGIGSAIIINKEIYRGEFCWGGEVGRQFIKNKKWESIASTSALLKRLGGNISGEEIFEKLNDPKINKIYIEWLDDLAEGFSNIISILNPGTIVVGGGVSDNPLFKMEDLKNNILKYIPDTLVDNTKIVKAKLGNEAALYGCVYMSLNN